MSYVIYVVYAHECFARSSLSEHSAYYLLTLVQQNTKLQYSLAIDLSVTRTEILKDESPIIQKE